MSESRNKISDVVRFLRNQGVSPRPTTTIYYDAHAIDPRSALPSYPYFSDVKISHKDSGVAESFSLAERVTRISPNVPSSPSCAVSPPRAIRESSQGSSVHCSDMKVIDLARVGYTPFHTVVFRNTRERFVFAISPLGDRVAIYVTPDIHFGTTTDTDEVSERMIETGDDAEQCGAYTMGKIAGACAEAASVSSKAVVFGIMTASRSDASGDECSYFALISRKTANSEFDVFTFAQSADSERAFHDTKIEPIPIAALPIVSIKSIENDIQEETNKVPEAVRKVVAPIESTFLQTIIANIEAIKDTHVLKLNALARVAKGGFSESVSHKNNVFKSAGSLKKATDLSAFSSKLCELLGKTMAVFQENAKRVEKIIDTNIAEAYIEARTTLSKAPITRATKCCSARIWGVPDSLDSANFESRKKFASSKISGALGDAIRKAGS